MQLPTPLLRKNKHVHKNSFGHVLVVAGSSRMLGAGALTSLAAMRSGAGMVTWAVPESLNMAAQKKAANVVMTYPLKSSSSGEIQGSAWKQIQLILSKVTAVAVGPGLTTRPGISSLVRKILMTAEVPVVLDADALNIVAKDISLLMMSSAPLILTPHPGEMKRLTGLSSDVIQSDRQKIAQEFSDQYCCTLVLKGDKTVVAYPGHQIYRNTTGNAGMATAGSGDVLTGMIAALLAQGIDAFESAKWGAYLHGMAGDLAVKKVGRASLIASDIMDYIPKAIVKVKKQ